MARFPRRAAIYIYSVLTFAGGLVTYAALNFAGDWLDVLAFFLLFGVVSLFATVTGEEVSVTVGFIVGLAAVAVTGPLGAGLVGLAGFAVQTHGTGALIKRLFNAAEFAMSAVVAGLVYTGLGGPVGHLDKTDFPGVLAAAAAASVAYYLVNNTLVARAISLTTGLSLRRVWVANVGWMTVNYLGYGLLGVLMAQVYYQLGVGFAVLFLAPLLVARGAFHNYAELRSAYDATVQALCRAVESKDYYTRGHSERVAKVTQLIAREWGMREDRVEAIRIAGMLHDVGKLGVPTGVLQKQGKLSQLEFEAIKLHPLRGYEMLCEIDFLAEALTGIYHHHERLDGRGYPMGLSGPEIPEFARIIMVADAFDSMTSTRSYRMAKTVPEAFAELRRCEGTQFDPRVVQCLLAAIGRYGWQPAPEVYYGEQVARDGTPLRSTDTVPAALHVVAEQEAARAGGD